VNEYTQIAGHIHTAGTAISKSISDHNAPRPSPPEDDDDREMTADDLLDTLPEAPLDDEEFHRLEARYRARAAEAKTVEELGTGWNQLIGECIERVTDNQAELFEAIDAQARARLKNA
jgi:DNA-directed RNA polymerase sigma subunit (sigma70/sigma32)